MSMDFICPRGHRWKAPSAPAGPGVCPDCGQTGSPYEPTLAGAAPAAASAADEEMTLAFGRGSTTMTHASPRRTTGREGAPPVIPGYEVLECLGRGGMGAVYRARDERLNRQVALKIVTLGPNPQAEDLLRFQIEAESLARLQHPGVVQVYEVGERDEQPFLAMELVEGPSLASYLEEHALSPRQAASLAVKLARAVHAAHLRGIVHRDLKPANILLAADDEPKLTDFGLAKRMELDSNITRPGMVVGTPSYMAPEQAEGESSAVGPASDVYALGALLYEMLAGRKPFVADTVLRTLEMIRLDEPPPPSRFGRHVPRDLETICLKCLQKLPAGRYASAADLADDLQRYLRGEPVAARPLGRVQRAIKWCRRRPAAAMSLLLMACGLGAALAAGLWHHGQIRAQRDATHRYFQLSQQAVEVLLTEVAEEQLASTPHAEEKRRVILESALEFYQKLYAEHLQNPLMQADLAEAQIRLGDVERWLGRYDESAASYEQVIQRLKQALVQHRDEASLRHHLAEALNGMAELYRTTSRNQQAIEAYQQAIHINAELRLLYPQNVVYSADLARCHYSLALCLQHSGRPQEARGQLDTAIELLEQIVDTPERADRRFVQDLARAHLNLGVVLRHLQEHDKVESTYGRAIALYAQLSQRHPHQTDYRFEQALAINNLGNHLAARSRRSEALQQHRQARDILQGLTNDYSGVVEYRRELANSLNSLAHVHAAGGDQPAAAEHLQEAESHLRRLATHFDERPDIAGDLGLTLGNLAAAQLAQSDAEAAHRSLEEALVHLNAIRARSPDHPDYVAASQYALGNLAQAQFDLGKWTEIGELAERLAAAAGDSKGDALTALAYFGRLVALLEAETEEPLDGPPAELRIASRRQAAAVTRDALEQGFVTDDDLRRDPRYAPLLPLVLDSGSAADSR